MEFEFLHVRRKPTQSEVKATSYSHLPKYSRPPLTLLWDQRVRYLDQGHNAIPPLPPPPQSLQPT